MSSKKPHYTDKVITCSVCGQAGHTLVKDDKDGYKHQLPAICDANGKSLRND